MKINIIPIVMLACTSCSSVQTDDFPLWQPPKVAPTTSSQRELIALPEPKNRTFVAVYSYEDKTGQFRLTPNENQNLSRAVTQGAETLLINALRDAGNGRWFAVMERAGLKNLANERKIIQDARRDYLGETRVNPEELPPLYIAGAILEGGVIGYDSNTLTGGVGARLLGIGGGTQYRQNTVTVSLRMTSTKTGEITSSVTAQKSIISYALNGSAFKFIDFRKLLEAEAGITTNEPGLLALQQAIETAVHALIVDGAKRKLWDFRDPQAGAAAIRGFEARMRDSALALASSGIGKSENEGSTGSSLSPEELRDKWSGKK
jgi:curli production assembly/transport component CsgG